MDYQVGTPSAVDKLLYLMAACMNMPFHASLLTLPASRRTSTCARNALGTLTGPVLTTWCTCTGGLQEVRRLEKLRAKRAFEATLPPIDDVERLPERQAMIEAWEVQEWVEREEEIKGVQEERLALLAQALQVGLRVGL
jgi:hypothetical protein